MTLFIDVKHDGFNPVLDIVLSGYTYKHVNINQAMAVYLKRKSGVEGLKHYQATQAAYSAMSLLKEAAEAMIKEDTFDLLFYNNN